MLGFYVNIFSSIQPLSPPQNAWGFTAQIWKSKFEKEDDLWVLTFDDQEDKIFWILVPQAGPPEQIKDLKVLELDKEAAVLMDRIKMYNPSQTITVKVPIPLSTSLRH